MKNSKGNDVIKVGSKHYELVPTEPEKRVISAKHQKALDKLAAQQQVIKGKYDAPSNWKLVEGVKTPVKKYADISKDFYKKLKNAK